MTEVQKLIQEEKEKNRKAVEARRAWQNDHKRWFSLGPKKREQDD